MSARSRDPSKNYLPAESSNQIGTGGADTQNASKAVKASLGPQQALLAIPRKGAYATDIHMIRSVLIEMRALVVTACVDHEASRNLRCEVIGGGYFECNITIEESRSFDWDIIIFPDCDYQGCLYFKNNDCLSTVLTHHQIRRRLWAANGNVPGYFISQSFAHTEFAPSVGTCSPDWRVREFMKMGKIKNITEDDTVVCDNAIMGRGGMWSMSPFIKEIARALFDSETFNRHRHLFRDRSGQCGTVRRVMRQRHEIGLTKHAAFLIGQFPFQTEAETPSPQENRAGIRLHGENRNMFAYLGEDMTTFLGQNPFDFSTSADAIEEDVGVRSRIASSGTPNKVNKSKSEKNPPGFIAGSIEKKSDCVDVGVQHSPASTGGIGEGFGDDVIEGCNDRLAESNSSPANHKLYSLERIALETKTALVSTPSGSSSIADVSIARGAETEPNVTTKSAVLQSRSEINTIDGQIRTNKDADSLASFKSDELPLLSSSELGKLPRFGGDHFEIIWRLLERNGWKRERNASHQKYHIPGEDTPINLSAMQLMERLQSDPDWKDRDDLKAAIRDYRELSRRSLLSKRELSNLRDAGRQKPLQPQPKILTKSQDKKHVTLASNALFSKVELRSMPRFGGDHFDIIWRLLERNGWKRERNAAHLKYYIPGKDAPITLSAMRLMERLQSDPDWKDRDDLKAVIREYRAATAKTARKRKEVQKKHVGDSGSLDQDGASTAALTKRLMTRKSETPVNSVVSQHGDKPPSVARSKRTVKGKRVTMLSGKNEAKFPAPKKKEKLDHNGHRKTLLVKEIESSESESDLEEDEDPVERTCEVKYSRDAYGSKVSEIHTVERGFASVGIRQTWEEGPGGSSLGTSRASVERANKVLCLEQRDRSIEKPK